MPAINAVLARQNVLLVASTGHGKSACFEVPALVHVGKITIVLSPLKSLIQDQMRKYNACGIKSECREAELQNIFDELLSPCVSTSFVFVTPEKLTQSQQVQSLFTDLCSMDRITMFVVDEVHCLL